MAPFVSYLPAEVENHTLILLSPEGGFAQFFGPMLRGAKSTIDLDVKLHREEKCYLRVYLKDSHVYWDDSRTNVLCVEGACGEFLSEDHEPTGRAVNVFFHMLGAVTDGATTAGEIRLWNRQPAESTACDNKE